MPAGSVAFVLHAHLPFVRHPAHEDFLEERWLAEAITETYIPLLELLDSLDRDAVRARFTISLSPPLLAMLADPLLRARYLRHLDRLVELAEKEERRTRPDPAFHRAAEMYLARFHRARTLFLDEWQQDLISAFRAYHERGLVEIITCAATHGFLPLLGVTPNAVRAQIEVGVAEYRRFFGRGPEGFWLPECAYEPGLDAELARVGVRYFFVDTHGLAHATPRPVYGVYAPVACPSGVAAFARDPDSSKQVWSAEEGYPGDSWYRDFYRDIGFDLDYDYVRPYMPVQGERTFTGIKYHAITGTGEKRIYDRQAALHIAAEHAGHFLQQRIQQMQHLAGIMDRPPLILSPYDAELFGHWWYEGPEFLDYFVRKAIYDQNVIQLTTPWEYLRKNPTHQVATPSASSWGEEGYWKVWLNEKNEWIYPHLDVAQERMTLLARTFPKATALETRALKQAARELLLAQASDWPFILRTGTSPDYARDRVKTHLLRFIALHEQLTATKIDEPWLTRVEGLDNIFPDINYHYWE